MKKRKFLAVLATAIAGLFSLSFFRPKFHKLALSLKPQLSPNSPTGTLSPDQLQALLALGETIINGHVFSEDERRSLQEHISDRTQNDPGYLSLFQETAALLNRLSGSRFSDLPLDKRTYLLSEHGLADYKPRAREYLVPFRRNELKVRSLAIPDLITGYYRSAAGWAVVGYRTFPGQCGSLARYTQPEEPNLGEAGAFGN